MQREGIAIKKQQKVKFLGNYWPVELEKIWSIARERKRKEQGRKCVGEEGRGSQEGCRQNTKH